MQAETGNENSSDDGDSSSDDDLVVLPKKKKTQAAHTSTRLRTGAQKKVPQECEVICLDSDEEEEEDNMIQSEQDANGNAGNDEDDDEQLQRAIRRSLMPEWGHSNTKLNASSRQSSSGSSSRNLDSAKKYTRKAPKSSNRLSTSARNSLRSRSRLSNESNVAALAGDTYRRDLTGGSGLGLNGFQVRSEYNPWNNDHNTGNTGDDEDMESHQTNTTNIRRATATGARKRGVTSAASTSTATRGKKRKTTRKKAATKRGGRAGRGRKRNYKRRGNGGNARSSAGAWSTNERGITSYRGRGGNGGQRQPYMDVGKLDPNLGNAGGVSISFD